MPAQHCPPSPSASSSVAFWLSEASDMEALSSMYATWISSVETTLQTHHGKQVSSGPSRCMGASFVEKAVHNSLKQRASPTRDVIACWWARMHTLLRNLSRHRHRKNGKRQTDTIMSSIGSLIEECPERAHTGLRVRAGGDPSWKKWQGFFRNIHRASQEELDLYSDRSERISNRCQRRALDSSMKEFATWMETPVALGRLHKSTLRDKTSLSVLPRSSPHHRPQG